VLARHAAAESINHDAYAFFPAEVTNAAEHKAARAAVMARWGKLDGLINNAGYGRVVPFVDGDTDEWTRMINVNFWGIVHCSRVAIEAMRQKGGTIINLASLAGLMLPRQHSA